MRVDLENRVALVLGNPGGLGTVVAALLASNGARIVRETDVVQEAEPASSELLKRVSAVDVLVNLEPQTPSGVGYSQAAAASMAARDGGRIVQIASITGLVPVRRRADAVASDAGVFARTRAMALDFAQYGVLVNAIAVLSPDQDATNMLSHIPVGRVASSADVGNAILFLLAPASSYITGHVLALDGGWSAGFARDF